MILGGARTQWVNQEKIRTCVGGPSTQKEGRTLRDQGLDGLKLERLGLKTVLGAKTVFLRTESTFGAPCTAGTSRAAAIIGWLCVFTGVFFDPFYFVFF